MENSSRLWGGTENMRVICLCNSNIPWGGGEVWHLNAALSLAARGWRVFLLCHPEGELIRRARGYGSLLTVIPWAIGRLSFLNPVTHLRLRRFFRKQGVEALIMNLPADLKVAGPAARAAGVRHIIYRRGSALPVRDSRLNRYLYGKVITRLITNSQATRKLVLVNNPSLIPDERITVLPNGIDVGAFDKALAAAGSASGMVERTGERRPFVLGNAGRLNRQKGQYLLLRLGRLLLDSGLDFRLLIAGEGECEAELREQTARLSLDNHVVFCGFVRDMAVFWRQIDLFVLSSLWEGFGNVLIEAMLAEKPVFAFGVSNIPEIVFEGSEGNGRLFPLPDDALAQCPDFQSRAGGGEAVSPTPSSRTLPITPPDPSPEKEDGLAAMAKAVLELAADPAEACRMGKAGRAFAMRFSQDVCMDALEKLLAP